MNPHPPKKDLSPRDGEQQSPWQEIPGINGENLKKHTDSYDVIVVGAGITGLTTGLLLQQSGKRVVIAEAHTVGFGTTGGTSAHINTFADTTYAEAQQAFGDSGAKLFAEAVLGGFELIKSNIEALKINCDFEYKTGGCVHRCVKRRRSYDVHSGCTHKGKNFSKHFKLSSRHNFIR